MNKFIFIEVQAKTNWSALCHIENFWNVGFPAIKSKFRQHTSGFLSM